MLRSLRTRLLPISGLALLIPACNGEPEPAEPVVEQTLSDLPPIPGEETIEGGLSDTPIPAPVAGDDPTKRGGLTGGSNEDGARQPDPKRTKLIKADPE